MRAPGTLFSSLAALSVTVTAWAAPTTGTTAPPSSKPPSPDGSDFSVVAALDELPVGLVDEAPLVSMADLDAITAANGVPRPDATGSDDDRSDSYRTWLMTMTGRSLTAPDEGEPEFAPVVAYPPVVMATNSFTIGEIDDAVGFTLADASWFADVAYPPTAFTVYAGEFDDSTLSPDLVEVADGIVSLGEAEDFYQDPANRTALSILGTPQRLAQHDGRIAVSPDTALVDDWLHGDDTGDGHDATLVAVATALDDAGAVSAVLATLVDLEDSLGPASPEQRAALVDSVGDAALDDSFDDDVGIGWHAVDGESVITIVYSLDDDADPDAAAERVRGVFEDGESIQRGAPLADLLVVDDVTTDGSMVVATLSLGPEGIPWTPITMLTRMDLPFLTLD